MGGALLIKVDLGIGNLRCSAVPGEGFEKADVVPDMRWCGATAWLGGRHTVAEFEPNGCRFRLCGTVVWGTVACCGWWHGESWRVRVVLNKRQRVCYGNPLGTSFWGDNHLTENGVFLPGVICSLQSWRVRVVLNKKQSVCYNI